MQTNTTNVKTQNANNNCFYNLNGVDFYCLLFPALNTHTFLSSIDISPRKIHSVEIHIVRDLERRIRDIVIGFPGAVQDSRVLRYYSLNNSLLEKCRIVYSWRQRLFSLTTSINAILIQILTRRQ